MFSEFALKFADVESVSKQFVGRSIPNTRYIIYF